MAKKFKQYAVNMSIIVKNALVKVYHSICMVEHYYEPLQQIYSIITTKISSIEPDLALQIFFKAFNTSIEPNKLVPTLLVFGIIPE